MLRTASAWILLAVLAFPAAGTATSSTSEVLNADVFAKSAEAARQAAAFYGLHEDPEESERVARIGYEVAQQSRFDDYPFSFYLVDMPVPNAFALPGGQIFVTRGMLDLGLSDDMLAGLLGHEIGHVTLQHGMKMQRRATLLNVLSQALLVGVLVSTRGDSDPGPAPPGYDPNGPSGGDRVMGAAAAGLVVSELLLRSYSREFEDQADDEGLRLAAAAGYDPDGFEKLMTLMNVRLPQSKEFGYWRTHPFFDSRVRAAAVRKELLKVQEPEAADEFRRATQDRLLALAEARGHSDELVQFLEDSAVGTWPRGRKANAIRIERLHERRDRELDRNRLMIDYGDLIGRYQSEVERARVLDPDSVFENELRSEIEDFRTALEANYPDAVTVFERGVFETEFLEVFASNFPESPQFPEVALALGESYARLGRTEQAVERFVAAWRAGPETPAGQKAERGLAALAPTLDGLGALQELADQDANAEIRDLARGRLAAVIAGFEDLDNGASYLKDYPESEHRDKVNQRLDELAENLYAEAILYQQLGDHTKAQDRIQQILNHAPLSNAAARLRTSAVLDS